MIVSGGFGASVMGITNTNGYYNLAIKPTNIGGPFALNLEVTSSFGTYSTIQGNITVTAPLVVPVDKVLVGTTIAGQTGTMPNRGAVTILPGKDNKTIPAGYHNGSGVVSGDPDLIAGNIKSGKNIFGVTGTLESGSSGTVLVSKSESRSDNNFDATTYWKQGYYAGDPSYTMINESQVAVIFRNKTTAQTAVTKTKYSMNGVKRILLYYGRDHSRVFYLALSTSQDTSIDSDVVRRWLISDGGGDGTSEYFKLFDVSDLNGDYYIKWGFADQGGSGTSYDYTIYEMYLN